MKMGQVWVASCGESVLGPDTIDGLIHASQGGCEWGGSGRSGVQRGCEAGTDESRMGAGEEERGAESGVGDVVAVRAGNTFDEAMEAEPAEVVAHLALAELVGVQAEERGEVLA